MAKYHASHIPMEEVVNQAPSIPQPSGAPEAKAFYDREGWTRPTEGTRLVDTDLFGVREDGPIRIAGHKTRIDRIREAFASVGRGLSLIECGCGGNPAMFLTDLCARYTGVDFSSTGLDEARCQLSQTGVAFDVKEADICKLPFASDSFDASFSAHVLYHIPDPAAQAAAISEMLRVTRPGGMMILVVANPRPLLFPIRTIKRLIADSPVKKFADKLRKKAPLPYKPMPMGWMRKQAEKGNADVEIISYAMASTWFNHRVSEKSALGGFLWRRLIGLEAKRPHLAARLGNYITLSARKR
jgi:ubiquinone/menaquinone biosynthesis C-methylase UbiE